MPTASRNTSDWQVSCSPFNVHIIGYDANPGVLEGEWPGTITMVPPFDSETAARKWYESDQWQAAAAIRRRSVKGG
jgi:uncharacterized protein (DUF1330 family)